MVPPLLALLVVLPLLTSRGFVLVGDMTFVPRQPWKPQWLGLDGSAPRAVPADAFVSVLSYAVPGDVIQKAVLLAILLLGGWGVMRLLDGLAPVARAAAAVLYLWNPYVFERLAIGHWGLLLGLAALPWVAGAARRVSDGAPHSHLSLWLWLALAAFSSPTGGVVAALVAVVTAWSRGARARNAKVCVIAVVVNLPWIVPGILGHAASSDPAGALAFAARPDTHWGTFGSLVALGGIWKTSVVPAERSDSLLATAALVVSMVAVGFLWRLRKRPTHPIAGLRPARLLACGALALGLAWLPATDGGAAVVELLLEHLPGAGLLRDSQKWLMPFVLVVAIGFGVAVDWMVGRMRSIDDALSWVAWPLVGLPVLLLPSLAWGLSGELHPEAYPAEWHQVASQLDAAGAGDDRVAILPWSAYVRYPWNDNRAALDPAIRFFPGEVVTNDDLVLGDGRVVRGEDSRSRAIGDAVEAGVPLATVLRAQGVRWALVEKGVPSRHPVSVPRGTVVHDGAGLTLVDLGSGAHTARWPGGFVVLGVDAVVAIGTVLAMLGLGRRRRRRVR